MTYRTTNWEYGNGKPRYIGKEGREMSPEVVVGIIMLVMFVIPLLVALK